VGQRKLTSEWLGLLIVGVIIWIVAAAMSLWFLGVWPRSLTGWLCVLAVGPVAFCVLAALSEVIGEAIGALPGIRHADRAVERRTLAEAISGTRVVYYLLRSLVILAPIIVLSWWLENKMKPLVPGALRAWWLQHFN